MTPEAKAGDPKECLMLAANELFEPNETDGPSEIFETYCSL